MTSASALLDWFDRHKRDLPWRRTSDPYAIWLSEVMLQQTRVETALPYFDRFLNRFPTVDALAAAPLDEVLGYWSGLGYYRRARQLHAAAQEVATRGRFPSTPEELQELPGIGEYTAAAVASIAFGVPSPVLDGNVERVLSRFLALEESPKKREARRLLLAAAGDLLVPGRPGDSNQALMELGATLCLPKNPKCLLCPLSSACVAGRRGVAASYPKSEEKRASQVVHRLSLIVEEKGKVLLFRRPDDAVLLAGTWELPWVDLSASEVATDDLSSSGVSGRLAERYGGRWTLGEELGGVRHGITYRDLRVAVRRGAVRGGDEVKEGLERLEPGWFDEGERGSLPLSSLVGKVLALLSPARPARRSQSRRR